MEQSKLEGKVSDLFERQGFELERIENGFKALKEEEELTLKVFSLENFSEREVREKVSSGEKIFLDSEPGFELENDVSVIREEEDEPEYDTPSYEVIGDIAVISDLAGVERDEAVEGIRHHQNVKTILLKEGGLDGEFRVGEYEKLYGEETETEHVEFGCRYRVDPTKMYFSERFSTERKRVVDQIEEGEQVLVMFAGVGPFAVLAANKSAPSKVVSIEKNPEAAKMMKENIKLNGVEDIVEGVEGDVREELKDRGEFDRIVMPLPGSADEFLELAFEHSGDNAVIHYYRFVEDEDLDPVMDEIRQAAEETSRRIKSVDTVVTGERGPGIERVCFDIQLED